MFNHANVSVRLGPLRTSSSRRTSITGITRQDAEAIDRNFAAHFAFLDHLFGTARRVRSGDWPERYGVVGDYVPNGFFRQLVFPLVWKG